MTNIPDKDEFIIFEDSDLDPISDIDTIAKKKLLIVFLVDTSGSMEGTKIGTLNTTMEEVLPLLRNIGSSNTDIEFAVLTFSDGCQWMTDKPMTIEDYQYWINLKANGMTDLGEAFKELCSKLSRREFIESIVLNYAPVLFLLTDGHATDDAYDGLEHLKCNKWYKYALKIALGIGDQFDRELLERFTENKELVLTAKTSYDLARMIKEITIKSAQIGSTSILLSENDGIEYTYEDVKKLKERELEKSIKYIKKEDDCIDLSQLYPDGIPDDFEDDFIN